MSLKYEEVVAVVLKTESSGNTFKIDGLMMAAVLLALTIPAAIVIGRAAAGVSLGLVVIAVLTDCVVRRRLPVFPPFAPAALAVFGVLAVTWLPSILGSLVPLKSAAALLQVGCSLLLALLAVGIIQGERSCIARMVFMAALTAALVVAAVALTVYPDLLAFRFADAAHLRMPLLLKAAASIAACAIPVAVLLGWRLNGRWRWCALAIVVLTLLLMLRTHSKSSLAGLLAAGSMAALLAWTRPFAWRARLAAWSAAAGLGVAGLAVALTYTRPVSMGGYSQFAPVWLVDAHRQVIWQFALDLFGQHPWTGWGLSVVNQAPGAGDTIPELGYEFIPSHTHDWAVQILSEAGIVGFVPLVAIVVGVVVIAARRWYRDGDPAVLAVLSLWVTYWASGLFNFSLWNAWWQSSLAVLMGFAVSMVSPRRPA